MGGKTRGGFKGNEKKPARRRADDEMDVDIVRVKGPKVGLTREKRERLTKTGKCWHCYGAWEPGHMCSKKNEAQKTYRKEYKGGDSRDKTIRALQAQLAKLTNKDSTSEKNDDSARESSESEAPLRKKVQNVRFTKKGKGRAAPGFGSDSDFGEDL
jgi:hypothetical protein